MVGCQNEKDKEAIGHEISKQQEENPKYKKAIAKKNMGPCRADMATVYNWERSLNGSLSYKIDEEI